MKTFNTTFSLISLDKKLSEENYPNIVFTDDNKTITESQARFSTLNYSWVTIKDINLDIFLNLVVNESHPFCPAEFIGGTGKGNGIAISTDFYQNGHYSKVKKKIKYSNTHPKEMHIWRNKNNFKSIQLLCIDIDSGYNSVDEIKQAIFKSPIKDCSFIYSSPSFNEEENKIKVRVGWLLDEPIYSLKEAEDLLYLITKFFKSDDSCKEVARLYFNGLGVLYKNVEIVFSKELISNKLGKFFPKKSPSAQSSYIYTLKQKCAATQFFGKILESSEDFKEKMINIGYKYYSEKGNHNNNLIRNFDFVYAVDNNPDLINFANEHLGYSDLFKLAINCMQIEGGLNFMNDIMNKNNSSGISHYNNTDFNILSTIRNYQYIPQSTFFFEDCKPKKDYYIKQVNKMGQTITLKNAETKLNEFYNEAICSKDTNIHIIKVPTGLGKTKLLEDIEFMNVVLAFPNHMLKDEVSFRIENSYEYVGDLFTRKEKRNNKFITTPKLPELSTELQYKVNYLYKVGLSKEVSRLFDDVKKHKNKYKNCDVEKILKYKNDLFQCFKGDINVVTTHKMTQYIDFKQSTIIYDEDPFSNIIELKHISGKDLNKLFDIFADKEETLIYRLLKQINSNLDVALPEQIFTHLEIGNHTKQSIINELLENDVYNSNIISFLTCTNYYMYFGKDTTTTLQHILKNGINYVNRTDLPKNKKIIIFSATASETIYKQLYGDRVKFYNISNVETIGEVFQDTRYSYTRSCLNWDTKKGTVKKYIDGELKNKNIDSIITFKGYNKMFNSDNDKIYYGNVVGFDKMKGKDIAIIGTPYYADWSYVLMAKAINQDNKFYNVKFQKREIEFGNFIFKINTFEDDILKDLHLEMTTSEIIQAIGRARILREKCNVYLFSNIPIEGATQKYLS